MKSFFLIVQLSTIILFNACQKERDSSPACQELEVLVDETAFLNAPDDPSTIDNVRISGDCLTIHFSSGGCDGSSWELKLIDSGALIKTNPPQRQLRLSLKNNELCDAWISRELTFNIQALKVNDNKVYLNIENYGTQILYEY